MRLSTMYIRAKSRVWAAAGALIGAVLLLAGVVSPSGTATAAHNGAVVEIAGGGCEPLVFSAEVADPEGTHLVGNMRLVVFDGATTQDVLVPVDGTSAEIVVGPFEADTTVQWRVFGGGERVYDDPLWDGFGEAGFAQAINDYAASVGGFEWVVAGPGDPNPFINWHELDVDGCSPETKDDCKHGGWEAYGFRNQGLCIRLVNTGMDSRD